MENDFKAVRIVKSHELMLNADVKTVFPLLCPVKERDWVNGWETDSTLIYSQSGIAEEACIFESNLPEGRAVWICSKYDPKNNEIVYIKHILDKAIIQWGFKLKDHPENKSIAEITYNITGLSDEGNKFSEGFMETGFSSLMHWFDESLNYYLETGKMKK
ncbi:MAG: hypothetical protein N2484_18910 [Clostridia bacterium]|nr:hypothetical protein [Clostridia bacterium]